MRHVTKSSILKDKQGFFDGQGGRKGHLRSELSVGKDPKMREKSIF